MFPQVTIGSFEVEGLSVRVGSRVQGTIYTPLLESTEDLEKWQNYSNHEKMWIQRSIDDFQASPESLPNSIDDMSFNIVPYVAVRDENGALVPSTRVPTFANPVAPWWQTSPPPVDPSSTVNLDLLSIKEVNTLFQSVSEAREGLFGPVSNLDLFAGAFVKTKFFDELRDGDDLFGEKSADLRTRRLEEGDDSKVHKYHPASIYMQPVFEDKYNPRSKIIGLIHTIVQWDAYVVSLLPPEEEGLRVVLRNNCDQVYTYEINGPNVRIPQLY
jgi:hypothetical protein